jgi:predicted nucleotidyltransferase
MDTTIRLQEDFKEFLKLLEASEVDYLLVGGYAVGFYGYPRPTGDMDIWISRSPENAEKVVAVLNEFGFSSPEISAELFTLEKSIVRMGIPPFKLEIITHIDGVKFDPCFQRKEVVVMDGCNVSLISLADLKINKQASGRPKDINDLENL